MSGRSRTGVVPLPACNTDGVGMSCNRDKAAARQRLLCTSRPTALRVPHVLAAFPRALAAGAAAEISRAGRRAVGGLVPRALRYLPQQPVVTPVTHAGVRREQEERARLASAVVQQA